MRQYLEVRCHLCAIAVGLLSACMASRRKSYTLDFKSRVVSSLTLNEGNVSATAKMHGIHRKLVQSWRKQHAEVEKLATGRDTTGRKRRRLLRTPKDGSDSYKMVAEWVDECWKATDDTLIAKSFNACGIVTPENGETLNSRLQLLIGGGSLESELSHSDFSDNESDDKSDDESDDQSDDQSDDESERPDESTRSR